MSSRTPLGAALRRAFAKASLLDRQPDRFPDADALADELDRYNRRRFLTQTAKAGAAVWLTGLLPGRVSAEVLPPLPRRQDLRIAIVGGGLAGLTAAYHLRKAGISATVYEASERSGGRMFSATGQLGPGLVTEMGGEYIDSDHRDIFRLVRALDLDLLDMEDDADHTLAHATFRIGNRFYTENELLEVFRPLTPRIAADAQTITDTLTYRTYSTQEQALDRQSIAQYLSGLDLPGWFYELLDVAYTSEMGVEIGDQSALNFVTFIGTGTKSFEIFGSSNERYKVLGGNQRITDRLAERLREQLRFGHALQAVRRSGQAYELVFQNGPAVTADLVLLTLPFTKLREVDLQIDLPPGKRRAIEQLRYGTNSKLMLGMNERVWRRHRAGGYLFDSVAQNGWDNSRMQTNNAGPGGYTVFLGGRAGQSLTVQQADQYLQAVEGAFPGAAAAHADGRRLVFNWASYPHARGSYASYGVGQWTELGGAEAEPVDGLYFAGEHCSVRYKGFMNGAAETGRLAAQAMLKRVRTARLAKSGSS